MKFKAVLWASVVLFLAAVPAFSQRARTVTNMDLEKYKQQRLKAEKDYAENYQRLGFPSPEELQKQIEKSRVEREALSARLTAERLQREQIEADLAEAARLSVQDNVYFVPSGGGGGYFGWPYGYFPSSRFPRSRQYNWPGRIGNGQPIVDYSPGHNVRPHFPRGRGRRY